MKIDEIVDEDKLIKLRITNMDDLWLLSNFIEKGDIVIGNTFRKIEERSDQIRSKKEERIKIRVGIKVEDIEFQEFTDRLRIKGKIVQGPEEFLGHYQSLNFSSGDSMEIVKNEWSKTLLDELKKSEKENVQAIFISMDDVNATIALLRDYGIQILAEIDLPRQSKEIVNGVINYNEITLKLEQYWKDGMLIFVVGPGFFKENFLKSIQNVKMKESMILIDTSYAGEKGIYEALKAGTLEKIIKENRMKKEIMLVSKLLEEISRNGKYAYGIDEVIKYSDIGAVDILLISDKYLKNDKFKDAMRNVEKNGGKIFIISSHHEYGRILYNLGGIGAILRYKI
ncbi:MAG: mRNA surveillance protein pelota [Thermoplasmata archaeon]